MKCLSHKTPKILCGHRRRTENINVKYNMTMNYFAFVLENNTIYVFQSYFDKLSTKQHDWSTAVVPTTFYLMSLHVKVHFSKKSIESITTYHCKL